MQKQTKSILEELTNVSYKKDKENITQGIIFAQKKSLNLVFFQIHGCSFEKVNTKKSFSKHYGRVTKIGGSILLATGILILTNQIQVISYFILTNFPFLTTLG